MNTTSVAVSVMKARRDALLAKAAALDAAIHELQPQGPHRKAAASPERRKRVMSEEQKEKLRQAAKARYAKKEETPLPQRKNRGASLAAAAQPAAG